MRISRVYIEADLATGRVLELSPEAAAYVGRVLRLRSGDPLVLFNGHGGEFEAMVGAGSRGRFLVEVGAHRDLERESPLAITLGLGVSRGERMDYGLQKAVELGVAEVVPLLTERCVVQLDRERAVTRLTHWRRVMASACEQCGRNRVPRLGEITGIADWLETVAAVRRLVLSPVAATALADLPPPEGPVVLLVGPEGGLAPVEVALAERAGFTPLRLGPRVLRTETAVVAALAAIQGRWGDLGRGSGAGGPGGLPVLPPADDGRDNP